MTRLSNTLCATNGQELVTPMEHIGSLLCLVGLCCSIFSFLWCFVDNCSSVCPFPLASVLSVGLRFAASVYIFGVFELFLFKLIHVHCYVLTHCLCNQCLSLLTS
jgi:hypothetical protein